MKEPTERQKEKEKIRPYRKYQLKILLMILLMSVFTYKMFSLYYELKDEVDQVMNIENSIQIENDRNHEKKEFFDILEVNYDILYKLKNYLNTDIISTYDELLVLYSFFTDDYSLKFEVIYKASKDGDSIKTFREKCSGFSPFIILIETVNGYKFGVYSSNPIPKDKNFVGYVKDDTAFIFSFYTEKKYDIIKEDKAIGVFDHLLPYFGEQDIFLGENFLTKESSYCNFPSAFEEDKNSPYNYILTGGVKNFKIKELEFLNIYMA